MSAEHDRCRAWMANERAAVSAARRRSDQLSREAGMDPDVVWLEWVNRRSLELECRSAVLTDALSDAVKPFAAAIVSDAMEVTP